MREPPWQSANEKSRVNANALLLLLILLLLLLLYLSLHKQSFTNAMILIIPFVFASFFLLQAPSEKLPAQKEGGGRQ